MGLNSIHRLGPIKHLVLAGWRWDALNKFRRFQSLLEPGDSLLDIGSGYGTVTDLLREKGFKVTPVDVKNQAVRADLTPALYDGQYLPYHEDQFDKGLLLTVLHHTPHPEQVLTEGMRVSKQLIVIEDVYRHQLQRYLTYWADSFFNFEFRGHPHTNKSRKGWVEACRVLGLQLQVIRSDRFLLFFRQETYLISALP